MAYIDELRAIKLGIKKPDVSAPKKLEKKSNVRKDAEKEYKKIVKEFLAKNPNCEVNAPGCQTTATGLHHLQKRSPENYKDRKNLIRACNNCQMWVELNPKEALKKGYSISRFAQTKV